MSHPDHHRRSRRRLVRVSGTLLLAAALPAVVLGLRPIVAQDGAGAPRPSDRIGEARSTLERWVETRRLIAEQTREWEEDRRVLEDQVALYERQVADLLERTAKTEASIAEADEERAGLIEKRDALEASVELYESTLARIEGRVRSVVPRLPQPLRDRLLRLTQQLPEDGEESELSISTRFITAVGIMNEVNRFNAEIGIFNEMLPMPDGTTSEVTTLYVGVGQGYYVGGNGVAAGIGGPTADGWSWTPADDLAESIALAVAIKRGEQAAAFVPLPIRVQ